MITLTAKGPSTTLSDREHFLKIIKQNLPDHYVLLNTCDRVELYEDMREAESFVNSTPLSDRGERGRLLHRLCQVTAGLDSPLLGETAIQGQVKKAYQQAIDKNHISSSLHSLFKEALRISKRVRRETGISRGAMSHGQAVIEILKTKEINITDSNILILGANHLNKTVLKYLIKAGNKTTFISSRSFDKAEALSKELGCTAVRFDEFSKYLANADIIISATSAPRPIITRPQLANRPTGQQLTIFDLAFPRDVAPEIGKMAGVTLYNVHDIEKQVLRNKKNRTKKIKEAERIINEEICNLILNS